MTMANWIELTHDENNRMTCALPSDEDIVEVRLEDGTECIALFYCLGYDEWGFTTVLPDDEINNFPDEIENVVAWRPQQNMRPTTIDPWFIDDKFAWSLRTFGPEQRIKGVTDHIIREAIEARENPQDASEWADIILLAMDGASRSGISGAELIAAVHEKQTKNVARKWPDWHGMDPDQAIEHIKEAR